MSDKPKFFFEGDGKSGDFPLTSQEHADTFFSTLQAAGVIQETIMGEDFKEKKVAADADMKKLENKVLSIEYGTYQANYAIHITPVHPRKNLATLQDVKQAMYHFAMVLHEYVPHEIHINLFPPQADWKMKVISAVILNGAKAWNLNVKRIEEEAIPKIFAAVEKVIMK